MEAPTKPAACTLALADKQDLLWLLLLLCWQGKGQAGERHHWILSHKSAALLLFTNLWKLLTWNISFFFFNWKAILSGTLHYKPMVPTGERVQDALLFHFCFPCHSPLAVFCGLIFVTTPCSNLKWPLVTENCNCRLSHDSSTEKNHWSLQDSAQYQSDQCFPYWNKTLLLSSNFF